MVTLKELSKEEILAPGHRLCAGCGATIIARMALKAARGPAIVAQGTGCLEVATTIYPFTAWRVPWIHVAFENAGAVTGGVEAAFKAFEKKGMGKKPDIITFGGDGGTFDIGLQALSGALERGHDFTFICYDNEAYMNTGIQRSGGTPHGAATTTSWAGKKVPGKPEWKKDLAEIVAAHDVKYVATATPANWNDFITKVRKAIEVDGPAFIHALAPCPRGWRFPADQTIKIAKLAVNTCFFPVYEIEDGRYKINVKPANKLPVDEYLKSQGRFEHLFKPEFRSEIAKIQEHTDKKWNKLLKLAGESSQ